MIGINNREQLIQNATDPILGKARSLALRSLECALTAADPAQLVLAKVQRQDSTLFVDGIPYDLEKFRHIYVVGGGKAGSAMLQALEQLLGSNITGGIVNVPYGSKRATRTVELHEASHPVPDQVGVVGTERMIAIAEKAQENDLLVCLLSGGGSSLMPLPRVGISLKDKQKLTNALLKSGAPIDAVNMVRKHLSDFKGGWLARKAYPATVLSLILSDVMGDPLDSIASAPTVPDSSTFQDAVEVLKRHSLWQDAPSSIRETLTKGVRGYIQETPKSGDPAFSKVHNVVVGNNRIATSAAAEYLKSEGLNVRFPSEPMDGEARSVGGPLASLAKQAATHKPAAIVLGGETTVTVKGEGVGGRNQELALSSVVGIAGIEGCVVACLSTDGVDGPTDAAGAIADTQTLQRAKQLGLDAKAFLEKNDSYNYFLKLGDLICTGPTGTNVNDICITIIL